jgi:mutator protein MutT
MPSPPLTRVVAAVVADATGRLLVCQRPAHKRHGGLWEFPGGKIEKGETDLHAARRELSEELGVTVTVVGQPLLKVHDPGSPFVIEFMSVQIEGQPTPLEHSELRWVEVSDLLALPLAPSDRAFAQHLQEHESSR